MSVPRTHGAEAIAAAMKKYRKYTASGAMYDDPCVSVEAGRFDGVGAQA